MATKSDPHQPATKGDLRELREGIKKVDERLSGQIEDLDERLSSQIKDVKEALSNQTDNLTTQIDGLAKLIKDQIEEFQIHKLTHQRQDDSLTITKNGLAD